MVTGEGRMRQAVRVWLPIGFFLVLAFVTFVTVLLLRGWLWQVLGFVSLVLLQLLIMATGNYGFFNLLAIVLCLSVLDDRDLEDLATILRRKGEAHREGGAPSEPLSPMARREARPPGIARRR